MSISTVPIMHITFSGNLDILGFVDKNTSTILYPLLLKRSIPVKGDKNASSSLIKYNIMSSFSNVIYNKEQLQLSYELNEPALSEYLSIILHYEIENIVSFEDYNNASAADKDKYAKQALYLIESNLSSIVEPSMPLYETMN